MASDCSGERQTLIKVNLESYLGSWKGSSWSLSSVKSKLELTPPHEAGDSRRKVLIWLERKMPQRGQWQCLVGVFSEVSFSAAVLPSRCHYTHLHSLRRSSARAPLRLCPPQRPGPWGRGHAEPGAAPPVSDEAVVGGQVQRAVGWSRSPGPTPSPACEVVTCESDR